MESHIQPEEDLVIKPCGGSNFFELASLFILLEQNYGKVSCPFDYEDRDALSMSHEITWTTETNQLGFYNQSKFNANLTECFEDKTSLLTVVPLYLKDFSSATGHANLLLFFKRFKVIVRIDPHGFKCMKQYNPELLDDELNKSFQWCSEYGFEYKKHTDIEGYTQGPQQCEHYSTAESAISSVDPPGYCATWCFYLLDKITKNLMEINSIEDLRECIVKESSSLQGAEWWHQKPIKAEIRKFNMKLLTQCLSFTLKLQLIFRHSLQRSVSNWKSKYIELQKERPELPLDQASHAMWHDILIKSIEEIHGIDDRIFTIHGINMELLNELMEPFDLGPRKRRKAGSKAKKKKKKKQTKKKPKKKPKKKRKRKSYTKKRKRKSNTKKRKKIKKKKQKK